LGLEPLLRSSRLIDLLSAWGAKDPKHPPIWDLKGASNGCTTHATTVHEVDEFAIEGLGSHAGQFG
jgi:hypothetical protein